MSRMRRVLLVGMLVVVVLGATPEPGGARTGPDIRVIDLGPAGPGLSDLSERGHVAFDRADPSSGASSAVVVWHRGALTEVTPDLPTGVDAYVGAVNDHGDVAGHVNTCCRSTGFTWTDGRLSYLSDTPGDGSMTLAIDRRGRALANRWSGPSYPRASVVRRGGEAMSPLLDGQPLTGVEMNGRGQVVGNAFNGEGDRMRAFLWEPGHQPIALGDLGGIWTEAFEINDAGTVIGSWARIIDDSWVRRTFIWRDGRMTDLGTLGGDEAYSYVTSDGRSDRLNERDEVVGTSQTATGEEHAFLWRDGTMIDLGTLGGSTSFAFGVNDHGDVVGMSQTAAGELHAFLWRDGTMIDLSELAGATGPGESRAVEINDRGQVLGRWYIPDERPRLLLWETRPGRR